MGGVSPLSGLEPVLFRQRVHRLTVYTLFEDTSAGPVLGTIDRGDGTTQVTYNGWPLYYFAPEQKPGDAAGQNVADVWFVVSAAGGPIQTGAFVSTSDHTVLGTILTDARGRTLYLFTMDVKDRSTCSEGCALAWPPMLTVGTPEAEEAVHE